MKQNQRTLDFDQPTNAETNRIAEATSLPPPENLPGESMPPLKELVGPPVVGREDPGHYTLADYQEFRRRRDRGTLTFDEYRTSFERLVTAKESFQADLVSTRNAKELAAIAVSLGTFDAKRHSKARNAIAIFTRLLLSYVLDRTVSYSMTTSFEDAIIAKVRATTLRDFVEARLREVAEREQRNKALYDPRSFLEFRTFIRERGEADLSEEQLARYDRMHADVTRERRAAATPKTVSQFASEELVAQEFHLKEAFHEKRKCAVWVVQLATRVEPATFKELIVKARQLGGWYSSFKRSNAGFHFVQRELAERFTALLSGNADRTDVLAARKDHKEQTAAERLHAIASDLAARADEAIERSDQSLQNTARRADIQAGVRGRAYSDQSLARTVHSIAEALSRGEARYLDGIRHKTHVETLERALRLARWARIRTLRRKDGESTFAHGRRLDVTEDQPISAEDVRFAAYPYPSIYKRHLEQMVLQCRQTKGFKQSAQMMTKRLACKNEEFLVVRQEHDIQAVQDFLGRAKTAGFDVTWAEMSLTPYHRLQRANITDIHELRAALREYLPHRGPTRGDDPVKIAERELIGKDIPGFFPTPEPVITRMLELAEIEPRHSVLEPSCGKGDIVDAIYSTYPGVTLHAIEINRTLSDILAAKGYEVEFGDFLDHRGEYDRVVMNPPFEQQAEITHVMHATALLAPGGRLVSVMSEGPFCRVDNRSVAFRDWFDELGGRSERLPDDAFQGREAFRQTGVRTRLVIIDKQRGCLVSPLG